MNPSQQLVEQLALHANINGIQFSNQVVYAPSEPICNTAKTDSLDNIASRFVVRGQFFEAIVLSHNEFNFACARRDYLSIVNSVITFAEVCNQTGLSRLAVHALQVALEVDIQDLSLRSVLAARLQRTLSLVFSDSGKFDFATSWLDQACAELNGHRNDHFANLLLADQGRLLSKRGEYFVGSGQTAAAALLLEQAASALITARARAKLAGGVRDLGEMALSEAEIQRHLGNGSRALELAEEARLSGIRFGNPRLEVASMLTESTVHLELGERSIATEVLQSLAARARSTALHNMEAAALEALSQIALDSGLARVAQDASQRAAIAQRIFDSQCRNCRLFAIREWQPRIAELTSLLD